MEINDFAFIHEAEIVRENSNCQVYKYVNFSGIQNYYL